VEPSVTLTVEDGLGTLRLSRTHGNAINEQLVGDLGAACREAAGDDRVRGVLLAARGKLFCPGLDLQELIELDRPALERFMREFGRTIAELYALEKPMVAAIHGHAVAGGYVLSLAADWRVLCRGARVGLNEVLVGVPLPYGVAMILRDSVPRVSLGPIALLGQNYSDEAARDAGLVHELRGPEGFEAHCRGRLAELVSRDARSLSITKRYLRSSVLARIREQDAERLPDFLDTWFRPETRARMKGIVDGLRAKP
jgi:3,2-trans-enoyl-CoA isomerase